MKLREEDIAKFWDQVIKTDECWYWTGRKDKHGYGKIAVQGRDLRAHRLSYRISKGIDPGSMCVCHICDQTDCVNPDHLFLGSRGDNMKDAIAKGRMDPRHKWLFGAR